MKLDIKKTKKEIIIISRFIPLFNSKKENDELILGWKKTEKPDFLYYLNKDEKEFEVGLELSELVFREELYKLDLHLTEVDYPKNLKGFDILLLNADDDFPNRRDFIKLQKEVIEFLSQPGRLFNDEYSRDNFTEFNSISKYAKKMHLFYHGANTFNVTMSNLITSCRINEDFKELIKNAIFKKINESKKYSTENIHLLLYTEFQTDLNDGPVFEIISNYLSGLKLKDFNIKRIYLFLIALKQFYIFNS